MSVNFLANHIEVVRGTYKALVQSMREDGVLVVQLDALTHWAPPHEGVEIGLADLTALVEMIELAAISQGIELEFD